MTNVATTHPRVEALEMLRRERERGGDIDYKTLAAMYGKSTRWATEVRKEFAAEEAKQTRPSQPQQADPKAMEGALTSRFEAMERSWAAASENVATTLADLTEPLAARLEALEAENASLAEVAGPLEAEKKSLEARVEQMEAEKCAREATKAKAATTHDKGAMGFARAIFFTGLVWSVVANVNHAVQTVPGNPLAWCMQAVWPLLAFFLIESLVRVRYGQLGFGRWLKAAHIFGGFAVLSGALFISFGHMVDLMLAWNQSLAPAYATPIGIDGAALFGALLMLGISRSRKA